MEKFAVDTNGFYGEFGGAYILRFYMTMWKH